MPSVVVLYAHPYPSRSRANRTLLHALAGIDGVHVRSLYCLYPDFHIDVQAEQAAVAACKTLVIQHPLYWYAPPAMLVMWFEKVLEHGWAFGPGGTALAGKRCLWVTTTGSPSHAYAQSGIHRHPFDAFAAPVRQTIEFCGMVWLPPFVVHAARTMTSEELDRIATSYRDRIETLAKGL